jgi:hypothetical protein
MDTFQPSPDPKRERRQLILGIAITVLLFAVLITFFTVLIIKSGGRGNYYNDIMERDQLKSSAGQ